MNFSRECVFIISTTSILSQYVESLLGSKGFLEYMLSPCGFDFELMKDRVKIED